MLVSACVAECVWRGWECVCISIPMGVYKCVHVHALFPVFVECALVVYMSRC